MKRLSNSIFIVAMLVPFQLHARTTCEAAKSICNNADVRQECCLDGGNELRCGNAIESCKFAKRRDEYKDATAHICGEVKGSFSKSAYIADAASKCRGTISKCFDTEMDPKPWTVRTGGKTICDRVAQKYKDGLISGSIVRVRRPGAGVPVETTGAKACTMILEDFLKPHLLKNRIQFNPEDCKAESGSDSTEKISGDT